MATPFKMKGPSLYNSPMKQDTGKKLKLKDAARTGVGQFKDKIINKAKQVKRGVELMFDSGIYSNKYQAENPGQFKNSKINKPRFKAEKKKLLKK